MIDSEIAGKIEGGEVVILTTNCTEDAMKGLKTEIHKLNPKAINFSQRSLPETSCIIAFDLWINVVPAAQRPELVTILKRTSHHLTIKNR